MLIGVCDAGTPSYCLTDLPGFLGCRIIDNRALVDVPLVLLVGARSTQTSIFDQRFGHEGEGIDSVVQWEAGENASSRPRESSSERGLLSDHRIIWWRLFNLAAFTGM